MNFLIKIFKALFFWGVFGFVVLQVPYPESITQANITQLLSFFISLFLSLTFTLNIFLNFLLLSATLATGIIFLLVLKALDSLNLVTAILTLIAVGLLFSYFRTVKDKSLTSQGKIRRLTGLHRRKHE